MKENDKILNSSAGAPHRKQASGRAQVWSGALPEARFRCGAPALDFNILSFFIIFDQFFYNFLNFLISRALYFLKIPLIF